MSTFRANADLYPSLAAPRAARRVVAALLESWGAGSLRGAAEQLVNEFVTNAVQHAAGETNLLLELETSNGWLRVAPADGSALRPIVQELSSGRGKRWGMFVVDQLATRWGVEDHRGGKRVWFELMPQEMTVNEHAMPQGRGPAD